ncbi:diguanylate cyclase domain-containing protein [Halalkalibacter wakoensis]|uniref:diguanylate cyclase domain-containing protein n=1 Tax=Halalkalibacter wakoensis TaxID=127891 RepID=UPI000690BDA7|nr:sensor domain-containing diguanylate cyclase [Halalkalibacter wakoensis]
MTNQSENLKKLNRMEQEMNFLLKNSENAIFTLDNQGKFLKVSQSFERLIGYLPNYLIDVVRDIDVPEVKSYVKKVGAGHASTLKIHLFLESGSIPVTIQIEPIYENEKVIGGIGIIHKTFLKQKGKDELTELPNRRSLLDLLSIHIQEARAADEKLAIMFIDLDRFKHVNDTLGHEWGDSSLKIIANRLKSIVEQGNIVTRVGGDEFIVIKPQLQSANEVVDLAICLLKEIRRPVMIDQYEFTLTGSIGIAIYPEKCKKCRGIN